MAKRKVLKVTPVLEAINILILLIIAGFYTFRLVKYYLRENGHKNEGTVLLVDAIKKKQSYIDQTKGLVFNEEDNTYRYKGEVDDNYISYSGSIYRIISIDADGNVKAVSEDNVTLLYPGFNNGYEKSYVNKWLNESDVADSGVYEKTLVNSKSLLDDTSFCSDVIDDVTKITCDNVNNYKITMLSLYDYKECGGKSSFLNNGTSFNLGTLNKNNENYYVTDEGEIALNNKTSRAITIKPVITFSNEDELLGGTGKEDDPYIVEKHAVETLGDVYVGNIIKINGKTYKVVEILSNSVKVVSTEVLMSDEENALEIAFGGSNNAYSTKNTVGKYLNNTFLDSLDVKDSVVNSNWYIEVLSLANLDYSTLKNTKVSAKVGMLTMGDMYVNESENVLTILKGMEATNIINVINENGNFFGDTISAKYNVKPAFSLKYDLTIVSGEGTMDSPYELGVNNEEKGKEE